MQIFEYASMKVGKCKYVGMHNILQKTKGVHLNYMLQRYLGAAVVLIDIYSRTPSFQQSEPLPFKYKNVECKISS